eukprot:6019533-Prorocentrum_lima.AAC.1
MVCRYEPWVEDVGIVGSKAEDEKAILLTRGLFCNQLHNPTRSEEWVEPFGIADVHPSTVIE